jgi:hypothetical protein
MVCVVLKFMDAYASGYLGKDFSKKITKRKEEIRSGLLMLFFL